MPGFFLTEQNRFLLTDQQTGALTARGQKIMDHTPMARFGMPDDLSGALLWLLSPASQFVTGIVVPVDGGFTAYSGVCDDRRRGKRGRRLDEATVRELCAAEIARWNVRGRRVLVIVPDHTRTAPIDLMFRVLHEHDRRRRGPAFDVLIALGTHPPMSDEAINQRLGITPQDRAGKLRRHALLQPPLGRSRRSWSRSARSPKTRSPRSRGGLMRERVDVTINKLALDYDLLLIVGPTFPHEVVGFSGGNKYLFPGIAGREIIDMFHWLGALITNPEIIGTKYTPVRAVVDRAASMVPVERKCASLVVEGSDLAGLYLGTPEEAWEAAADLSNQIHVVYKDAPVPQRALVRAARCTTSSGSAESARTSWSRWSPTAAS